MTQVIVFGDVEDALRLYLETQLPLYGVTDADVACTIPNPRPDKFVTVQRAGGPQRDIITDSALILVECWAQTGSRAYALAKVVRGLLGDKALRNQSLSGLTVYRSQEVAGPAPLPDPDSDQSRYVLTIQVDFRGSVQAPA